MWCNTYNIWLRDWPSCSTDWLICPVTYLLMALIMEVVRPRLLGHSNNFAQEIWCQGLYLLHSRFFIKSRQAHVRLLSIVFVRLKSQNCSWFTDITLENLLGERWTKILTWAICGQWNGGNKQCTRHEDFHHRSLQPSKSFNGYLFSLIELVKIYNFCSDACTQKTLRDQIIKGLLNGDIVEHLLQEKDLSLDKMICVFQAQEEAKKQWAAIQQSLTSSKQAGLSNIRHVTSTDPAADWHHHS